MSSTTQDQTSKMLAVLESLYGCAGLIVYVAFSHVHYKFQSHMVRETGAENRYTNILGAMENAGLEND